MAQPAAALTEADKARKRAERFGIPVAAAVEGSKAGGKNGTKMAEAGFDTDLDKLKKRAERFGLPPPTDKTEVLRERGGYRSIKPA